MALECHPWAPKPHSLSCPERLYRDLGLALREHSPDTVFPLFKRTGITTQLSQSTLDQYRSRGIDGQLGAWAPRHSAFSASRLESFQNCPYHYFLTRVLKLHEPQGEEDVPAYVWGQFVHTLFYESKMNISKLSAIGETLFNQHRAASFEWDIYHTLLFGDAQTEGILDALKTIEDDTDFKLIPIDFEKEFVSSLSQGDDTLEIQGQIDVVLTDETHEHIVILDYKTGSTIPTKAELERFESLQLPLYLLAAQDAYPERTAVGGIIYHLKSPTKTGKHVLVSTKSAKKDLFNLTRKQPLDPSDHYMEALKAHVFSLQTEINKGNFSVPNTAEVLQGFEKNRPSKCRYCEFKRVCREPRRFSQ